MRVLVCGSRAWLHEQEVWRQLDRIHNDGGIVELVEGGCPTGADSHARRWASVAGVKNTTYLADWSLYGKAAGPIRNAAMAEHPGLHLCVAFGRGRGTDDMVRRAKRRQIPVLEIARGE